MKQPIEIKVNPTTPQFASWMAEVEKRQLAHHTAHFARLDPPTMKQDWGTRYVRIWRNTSAYAFIDRSTGDILMPATWKAPAKHSRGNIFNPDNGLDCTGPYGIAYIKGPHIGW